MKTAFPRLLALAAFFSALALTTGCSMFREDLLELEAGEESDITVEELYKRMTAATDPKGLYAAAKTYRLVQEVESVSEFPRFLQCRSSLQSAGFPQAGFHQKRQGVPDAPLQKK